MANWVLDKTHSGIGFSVRHMMISNVRGHFNEFDATVAVESDDITTASISVEIDPTSIDTRNQQRDDHLRSGDFFHVGEYPKIHFQSSQLRHVDGEQYTLDGQLTILGVTKPLTLNCEITGPAKDPWGNERIGVIATGSVDRKDFGLTYNAVLETGGVLIGDTVKLNIEMEFVNQG
ncbi:YceI family protein [Fodinisporobacter ferrooxydans]|uniref:YceI family protein n=1 Tax=Fodinisporobacter ferrooxydans TaxID=2901836 RepID=A0ABY4CMZ5_9BACL|nr:YceI family protein [Alicyclobacillaceae bacterium MYW30-H2]